MAEQNFPDRVLYNMDNLDVLRGMNDETVDLIATDPPFNKKRNRAASAGQYEDAWRWADDPSFQGERPDQWYWQPVHRIWLEQILDETPALYGAIESIRYASDEDTAAFMCFLGVRLLEMYRILKPTGSLYLHCDHSAGTYIGMVLRSIFGDDNLRCEITWRRTNAKGLAFRSYAHNHDTIFWFSKSDEYTFNPVHRPRDPEYVRKTYRHIEPETGRRYALDNLANPNLERPNLTYEWNGHTRVWRWTKERMQEAHDKGLIHYTSSGLARQKRYLDELDGLPVDSIWDDVKPLGSRSKERTGSPDQKPLALYERIISVSSNPGDMVLDPFCGCATTPIAAQNLGRRWVGIDRREDAAYHVANRLLGLGINVNEFRAQQQALMPEIQAACEIRYIPPVRTDDGDTAPLLGPVYRRRKPATMTRAEMLDILTAQWGIRCWGCGFEPPSVEFLDLDHILPASEGGSNELENRAPLCGPCNKRKSNTMTLTALRRDNRQAKRWYGHPTIDQRIDLRTARQWALDYLAAAAAAAVSGAVAGR